MLIAKGQNSSQPYNLMRDSDGLAKCVNPDSLIWVYSICSIKGKYSILIFRKQITNVLIMQTVLDCAFVVYIK